MMISEIELKCFKIHLMLELFMCLRLELLKLLLNCYSLGVSLFFQISNPNFLASFCCLHFFLTIFSIFSPITITKLKVFETK